MFKAVNTDSESQRKKISIENQRIRDLYMDTLQTLNIKKFLELQVLHSQNQPFYLKAKSNIMYNYVKCVDISILNENKEKYDFLEHKHSFFEVVEKNIRGGNFVRARKLLNLAKERGWLCNSLYSLASRIEDDYFAARLVKNRTRKNKPW